MSKRKQVDFRCDYCGDLSSKVVGHVNRARKIGANLYCDRKCAGAAKRTSKTLEQRRQEKRDYDKVYRAKNREKLKAKKAAYFQRTYNPEEAAVMRQDPKYKEYRRRYLAEYFKNPEKVTHKQIYDRKRRARLKYGLEWAPVHLAILDLEKELDQSASKYERMLAKGTLNKALRRARNGKIKRGYSQK